MINTDVKPLEETHPEVGKFLQDICSKKEPYGIVAIRGSTIYYRNKPSESLLPKKIGRNDPCICGSGKKFKKCCMNKL